MFNDQIKEALKRALMAQFGGAETGPMPAVAPTQGLANMVGNVASKIPTDFMDPAPQASVPMPNVPQVPTPPMPPVPQATPAPVAANRPTIPAPVSNTPSAMPQPAMPQPPTPEMPQLSSKYDDNARKQLYDAIAQRQKGGALWQALGGVADTMGRVNNIAPTNYSKQVGDINADATKQATDQFESGRKANVEDLSTNLALKKAGREETEYNDQNDPNSQMSRLAVGFLKRMGGAEKMGVVPGKTTYADSVKIMPMVEKYVAMEQTNATREALRAEKAKKDGDSLYQKKLQQLESVRADGPLKNTEVQRDAAGTAYRSLAEVKARTGSYSQNPVDYIDTLGQLYKARTGQAPTDTVFKHLIQDWTGGNINKVATFLTGQQLNASSNDVGGSLLEMVNRMGDNADMQHEGYMKTRMDTRGLSPEDAAALQSMSRGLSYTEQKQKIDEMLKAGRQTAGAPAAKPLSGGWKVVR